jgi:radical SAM superfamily enzyme YgiQ (UPF0313 family)
MSTKDFLLRSRASAESAPAHMTDAQRPLRVCVIQPPESGGVKTLLPHYENGMEELGYKPPLGVLYVATMVKTHSPHTVLVIDAIAERLDFAAVVEQVAAFAPDVVGISAWTDFWFPAHKTGRLIKERLPHAHLTYGGPHVSIFPGETLDHPFVDSVVVGDGEVPFLYLCNMVANDRLDNDFPGLHIKVAGGLKTGDDLFHIHADLDSLPIPDRTLLPHKHYKSVLSSEAFVTTMITSRGCPHRCTFCKLNFQKTLSRSAASVVAEFRQIHQMGIKEVEIYDDTFTWSKTRLREICHGLIDSGLHREVTWSVRDRVSSVEDELLALMHRAGCRRIHYGIESGVQRVIELMKKRITVEQARTAVDLAKRNGLTVLSYFMFGNHGESREDMEETIAFALSINADYAEFSITIPYAGTEMYLEALGSGLIRRDYWRDHAIDPVESLQQEVIETHVSLDTLRQLQQKAVRSFYFRPKYLVREVMKLKSPTEFVRKARIGMHLFKQSLLKLK